MPTLSEKEILDNIHYEFLEKEFLTRTSPLYKKLAEYIDRLVKNKVSKEYIAHIFCQECSFRDFDFKKSNYRKKDILNAGKYYIARQSSLNNIENIQKYFDCTEDNKKELQQKGKDFLESLISKAPDDLLWYAMGIDYKENYYASTDFQDKLKGIPFQKYKFSSQDITSIGEKYLLSLWDEESKYNPDSLYSTEEEDYMMNKVLNEYWNNEKEETDRERQIMEIAEEMGEELPYQSPNYSFDFFLGSINDFFDKDFKANMQELYKLDKGRFYYIWTVANRFAKYRDSKQTIIEYSVSHKIHKSNLLNAVGKKRFDELNTKKLFDLHGWTEITNLINNLSEEEKYRILGEIAYRTSEVPQNNLFKTHIYQNTPHLFNNLLLGQPNTIFVELNLDRPEEHILDYIKTLIRERKRNTNSIQSLNELLDRKKNIPQDMNEILFSSAPKTLGQKLADMFFIYDYVKLGFSKENAKIEIEDVHPIGINSVNEYLQQLTEYIDNKKYLKYYYSENIKSNSINEYLEPKEEEDNYYDNLSEPYQ